MKQRWSYWRGPGCNWRVRREIPLITYYAFQNLAHCANLIHAVSTRHGGVSAAPFATLNTSYAVGDDPDAVKENRRRIAQTLGVDPGDFVTAQQVHGTHVALIADSGWRMAEPSTADALITAIPGVMLSLRFADCVPILLYDPVRQAVGVAHAGWKGTVAGIVGHTVRAMTGAFATRPGDLLAGIGPSIGPCCYAVDEERASLVRLAFPWWQEVLGKPRQGPKRHGKEGAHVWYLDLWEANRRQLVQAGLAPERMEVAGLCTACHTDDFYSHRAENAKTGRFAVVIGLRQDGQT